MIHEIIKWVLIVGGSALALFILTWAVLGLMFFSTFISALQQIFGSKDDKGKGTF